MGRKRERATEREREGGGESKRKTVRVGEKQRE